VVNHRTVLTLGDERGKQRILRPTGLSEHRRM
jgi:hypothetical protein